MNKKMLGALFIFSAIMSSQSLRAQDWQAYLIEQAGKMPINAITQAIARFFGDILYENLRQEGREKAASRDVRKQFCSDELSMAKDWENSVNNVRQDIADLDDQCKAGDKDSLELREKLKSQHRFLVRQAYRAREHAITLAHQRIIEAAPAA